MFRAQDCHALSASVCRDSWHALVLAAAMILPDNGQLHNANLGSLLQSMVVDTNQPYVHVTGQIKEGRYSRAK